MFRKVIGFLVGFVGAGVVLVVLAEGMRVSPGGPGWLLLCIAAGLFSARLAAQHKEILWRNIKKLKSAAAQWRGLSGKVAPGRKKVALFIAGDANIFFPALVAMTSIHRYNSKGFDYFMCFERSALSSDMQAVLDKYGINFIDSSALEALAIVKAMTKLKGRWPVEVFLNWALQEHLAGLGYRYSVKADYDILCIESYGDLTRMLAPGQMMTGIKTGGNTELVSLSTAAKVLEVTGLACDHPTAINVGFMVFDNAACVQYRLFEKFRTIYEIIATQNPPVELPEQVAATILLHRQCLEPKYLRERFNMRVRRMPMPSGLSLNITNVHFISKYKPWLPITIEQVSELARNGSPILPFYRNLWLEHAASLPEFDRFCDQRPLTSAEMLSIAATALSNAKPVLSR